MGFRPDQKFVIAKRFKALRRKAMLSQKELGKIIDRSRQTVNEIERRRVLAHKTTWDNFCDLEMKHKQAHTVRLPVHWL
jgi:DNA-binding XRE family transcriptional regulator